jgi:Peptidase family M54
LAARTARALADPHARVLAVNAHELNFVFGIAQSRGRAAVISLCRLGLGADPPLRRERVLKEAVHELGHTLGLNHCPDAKCVMHFSNSLADTDRIRYELSWSVDGPVTNEQGEPVLGLCEYDHEGLPNTALIFVNPEAAAGRDELLISTLAHEFGHAIFEAPAWIIAARSPARRGLFASGVRQRYRSETPDEQHLREVRPQPDSRDFSEWRANEFMGSLLVPRHLLVPLLAKAAAAFKIPIEEARPATRSSAANIRVARDLEGKHLLILRHLIRGLASAFGVSRRFMRVRLVRYELIEEFQLILC